ncbi:hypothetical protein ACF8GB_08230 [Pseudomonas sp. xss_4]|uniref:hypothetical protein n=1 Tax=Pseudomonas TaxID=286 RepID=UPI002DB71D2D|nr:hypothetical protein [Pseudomonas fulva]MEC4022693.1 hypothetical protein [Pseudomonas fulva]
MFSALGADLNWRIVTLVSPIHSPPLFGWNSKGYCWCVNLDVMQRGAAADGGRPRHRVESQEIGKAAELQNSGMLHYLT